ncbi:MAG: hypothetical protein GY744_10610 [Gammaproteobacteria bacterium]|nr:hypothetical protein [Gammaproteobacteria bacterium]
MKNADIHKDMLIRVAEGLGGELLPKFVFVGGCTTALLVTDEFTREQIRHTDDVDLIVHLAGYASYTQLISKLRSKGFMERPDNDSPICAMWLDDLRVDIMPDDESILGFSNRWYRGAVKTVEYFCLSDQVQIKLIKPVYFVATKLEAYLGRGNNDPLSSHDIEDLLNVFDGRPELLSELKQAPLELKDFISTQISSLLKSNDFEYAVKSCSVGDALREQLIFDRLEGACEL